MPINEFLELYVPNAPNLVSMTRNLEDAIMTAAATVLNSNLKDLKSKKAATITVTPSLVLNDFTKRTKAGMHVEYPRKEILEARESSVDILFGVLPLRATGMLLEAWPKELFLCEEADLEKDNALLNKAQKVYSGTVMQINIGSFVLYSDSLHTSTGIMATMGTCPYLRIEVRLCPNDMSEPILKLPTSWLVPECYYDSRGQVTEHMEDLDVAAWKKCIADTKEKAQTTTLSLRGNIRVPSVVGITPLVENFQESRLSVSEHVKKRLGPVFWFGKLENLSGNFVGGDEEEDHEDDDNDGGGGGKRKSLPIRRNKDTDYQFECKDSDTESPGAFSEDEEEDREDHDKDDDEDETESMDTDL